MNDTWQGTQRRDPNTNVCQMASWAAPSNTCLALQSSWQKCFSGMNSLCLAYLKLLLEQFALIHKRVIGLVVLQY